MLVAGSMEYRSVTTVLDMDYGEVPLGNLGHFTVLLFGHNARKIDKSRLLLTEQTYSEVISESGYSPILISRLYTVNKSKSPGVPWTIHTSTHSLQPRLMATLPIVTVAMDDPHHYIVIAVCTVRPASFPLTVPLIFK